MVFDALEQAVRVSGSWIKTPVSSSAPVAVCRANSNGRCNISTLEVLYGTKTRLGS